MGGYESYVADFNGDGKADILRRNGLYVFACLSEPGILAEVNCNLVAGNGIWSDYTIQLADINGDGLTDILLIGAINRFCASPAAVTQYDACTRIAGLPEWTEAYTPLKGDFNGDGKQDLFWAGINHNLFCPGPGIGIENNCVRITTGVDWKNQFTIYPGDYNNDGKTDLLLIDHTGGTRFCAGPGVTMTDNCVATGTQGMTRVFIGEFNGDGATDVLYARYVCSGAPSECFRLSAGSPQPPDLLTQVSNGLNASTTITYLPITQSSVYRDSATSGVGFNPPVYPVSRINFPYYVVAHTLSSNGIGGTNRSNYFYRNGRSQALGRGFAGYATVEAHDLATDLLTITHYRQDYPYTGMASQQRSLVNGSLINLKHTVNTGFANKPYGGTRYFPYVSTSTEANRDLNGAAIASFSSTFDYDLFGNLILHERRSDENHVFRETRQYLNDTVNWVIGKPTQLVTQHTLPDATSLTRTTQMNYEPGTGFRTQEVIEPATATLRVTTDALPDAFGNVRSITVSGSDILSRTTTHTYDAQGRFVTQTVNPLGHTELRAYDARFGTITRHTSPNLIVTEWSYDSLGRKRSESRADGTQTAYDYTLCTTECTPRARHYVSTTATGTPTRIEAFDNLDRSIATAVEDFTAADTVTQITEYDAAGRVQRQSRPFFGSVGAQTWVSYTYDNLSRVRSKTHPDTGVVRTDYNGRVITMTNPRDHSTRYTKNSIGQTVRVDDARSGFRTYAYDPFGNLTRTQDQAGNLTTMSYDLRGRKRSMADPDMGNWSYNYNVLGELTSQTDAKNQTSLVTYDKLGRPLTKTSPAFNGTWTYDTAVKGIGKLAQATATGGYLRSHEYDIYGRPWRSTTTIDAVPYAMTQTYDSAGRPEIITYPTGFATRNVYAPHGYLQQLLNHTSGALLWQADALNEDGNVTVETFGNALIGLRSYDAATGRLNILAVGPALDDWSVAALGFDYDRVGNLRERADWLTGLQETFVYDELNRLTNVNGPAPKVYAYDLTGNLTSKTDVGSYAYRTGGSTRPHAVTQISLPLGGDIVRETSFNYDLNGSLLNSAWQERNTQTQQIVRSGPGHTVTWTGFNMPAQIQTAGSNMLISYGPEHQKIKRVQGNGTLVYPLANYEKFTRSDGLIEHRHTLYAGSNLIGQYTERRGTISNEAVYYFHRDHLGSIAVISDEAGTPIERHSHDAFGLRRNPDGLDDPSGTLTSAITRIGYTGHEQLDNVRLIDMNARVYDPVVGRFLRGDPIISNRFNTQNWNRYSYVLNNPLSLWDPTGKEPCDPTVTKDENGDLFIIIEINGGGGNQESNEGDLTNEGNDNDGSQHDWGTVGDLIGNNDLNHHDPYNGREHHAGITEHTSGGGGIRGGWGYLPKPTSPSAPVSPVVSVAPTATASNYRRIFYEANPHLQPLRSNIEVHHSIPRRFEHIMQSIGINIHELRWLRGIERTTGRHRMITNEWETWARNLGREPTPDEILRFQVMIDQRYRAYWTGFNPPAVVRPGQVQQRMVLPPGVVGPGE